MMFLAWCQRVFCAKKLKREYRMGYVRYYAAIKEVILNTPDLIEA